MKIVALDTAERSCSVALLEDNIPLGEIFMLSRDTHSRSLMGMIEDILHRHLSMDVADIDAFAAARGPGSFTGLRIGISAVKGLAWALSKPAAGISSLDGIAWQFSHCESTVCAMMDARRGQVYCAFYKFQNGVLLDKSPETTLDPRSLAKLGSKNGKCGAGGYFSGPTFFNETFLNKNFFPETLFAGSGAVSYQDEIRNIYGANAHFAPGFQNYVRASAIGHALFNNPELLASDTDSLMPVYLRRSDAEINYQALNPLCTEMAFIDKEPPL
ncbi:MAG: tRNA (adenosine(37)-N6)-threonylcarbamoyltransferase complex dimerization subunit type 1 TsaB [Desulfamplus sp.]|nr:tRNA (adenosine(37)-N6)-threonylcarbamoyltransferase complex dimerization subunit type 1 TsaB [Desulfamplus sp.]